MLISYEFRKILCLITHGYAQITIPVFKHFRAIYENGSLYLLISRKTAFPILWKIVETEFIIWLKEIKWGLEREDKARFVCITRWLKDIKLSVYHALSLPSGLGFLEFRER